MNESPPNLFDASFATDPMPVYRKILKEHAVHRSPFGAVVLARYEDVLFALRSPEIFSSEMGAVSLGQERPLIPLQLDPPQQVRYRKLLDPLLSRKRMLLLRPDVAALVNELIDDFVEQGECDYNAQFAVPLPSTVFLRLMGMPLSDLPLLLEFKDSIIRPEVKDPAEAAGVREATARRIYEYFDRFIQERRAHPKDDLFTHLLQVEVEGERLTREEILDISFLFMLGGLDTVTATLDCGMAYLARNPDPRRKLAGNPALAPDVVEEILRSETPVMQVLRIAKRDVTLSGVEIHRGDHVMLLLGAANADDAEFGDASRVDFERKQNRHLAFGGGPHRCLGSHLARMELETALGEWHRRIPEYSLRPGETVEFTPGIRQALRLPLVWEART